MKTIPYILTLAGIIAFTSCEKKAPPPKPVHLVSTAKPTVKDVPVFLDYIGNLTPNVSVQVMGQVSGILTEQFFIEGQVVKQGDLLLVIDPRPYEAALAKAEAQLEQTYASLKYAQDTTERYARLVEEDFVSQIDYDSYVTNVLTDEAAIEQNKADIATARINLGYCYITAPMNGVTGLLQVKPGNFVNANAGTVLTVLNQIEPILVDFYVPETDLSMIQVKQRAHPLKIQVFNDPSKTEAFEGTLTLIDNQVNQATGAILMQATIPNPKNLLWPGRFVDVRVFVDEKHGVFVVPTTSVMIGQSGHYVYAVKPDNTIEMKNIQIGQRHGEETVIYSGIAEDDNIVVSGQLNLYPGLKVTIQNKSAEAHP